MSTTSRVVPTAPIRTYRHDVSQRPMVVIWEITQACPLDAAARLRAFPGSGELPEGWVCMKARSVTPNAGR